MPNWALPAFSWLVSFYFLLGFCLNIGFPPDRRLLAGDVTFVALWLFFLFLPFFKKVKIGTVIELEREVEKAKEEVAKAKDDLREFKSEVRSTLQVLSTNVNTIGGMSNQVTVNLPGLAELQQARELVESKAPEKAKQEAEQVEKQMHVEGEDPTAALAMMRIQIERLLRRGLGRRLEVTNAASDRMQFMSLNRLFETFLREYPDFSWLRGPFRSAVAVANAAVHAQNVPSGEAEEALKLGSEIIATLQQLFPEPG